MPVLKIDKHEYDYLLLNQQENKDHMKNKINPFIENLETTFLIMILKRTRFLVYKKHLMEGLYFKFQFLKILFFTLSQIQILFNFLI